MDIPEHIKEKLYRLYSNEFLGEEEIKGLENWLVWARSDPKTEQWLLANWEQSINMEVDISLEEIYHRIEQYGRQTKTRRIRNLYFIMQKVASILIFPLLALSIWLLFNNQPTFSNMMLATAKGERTHIYLPDGSEVWLNVDSKLEYSTGYNATNRLLKLKGEAFFKVAKGQKYPFVVNALDFQVKAIGTEFLISAYDGEPMSTTFLKEGVVKLIYSPKGMQDKEITMHPGEEASISLAGKSVELNNVTSEKEANWINGELFFENETMDEVFRKAERWYNVKIEYNKIDFINETLTVKLKKGESIERLMQIIDRAMGIKINQNGEKFVIKRK